MNCPTCFHAASAPYRRKNEQNEVTEGCVDAFHDGALVCDLDAAWHNRPEAAAIRATRAAHLAELVDGGPPPSPQRAVNAAYRAIRLGTSPAKAVAHYAVEQLVEVHAFGHWYNGQVVKVGKTRVTVRYTSGTGVTREKSCEPGLVRVRS